MHLGVEKSEVYETRERFGDRGAPECLSKQSQTIRRLCYFTISQFDDFDEPQGRASQTDLPNYRRSHTSNHCLGRMLRESNHFFVDILVLGQ